MHGYPATAANTHGAYLAGLRGTGVQPYAGFARGAKPGNAVIGQGADGDLFQKAQVFADVSKKLLQVQNRITHQLTRAMEGDIAPPVSFYILDVALGQLCIADQKVAFLSAFAQGVHQRMLAKQQVMRRRLHPFIFGHALALGRNRLLQQLFL